MDGVWPALLATIPIAAALIAASWRASKIAAAGTAGAKDEIIATYKGLNAALTEENVKLRSDLAGCESENRGFRRRLRND